MTVAEILQLSLPGGTLGNWVAATTVAFLGTTLAQLGKRLACGRLKITASATATWIDDLLLAVVAASRIPLFAVFAVSASAQLLELPEGVALVLGAVTGATVAIQAGLWAGAGIDYWIDRTRQRTEGGTAATGLGALSFIGKAALWSIVLLLILNNIGIDVTALIAGLGIGGIAVALALQNVLGDLFASLSIILDRPFVVGDFVVVDDYMGTIEAVGLKTTRVRSLSGEQIIFANSDLLKSRLRNYKRMYERRVLFSFGVVYGTGAEQLRAIPAFIRTIVESQPRVRFERAHFARFGESSLDFEVVYWVLDPDYGVHMDIQQAINLRLFDEFGSNGIEFAYPTRTLHISGAIGAAAAEAADGRSRVRRGQDEAAPSSRTHAPLTGTVPAKRVT